MDTKGANTFPLYKVPPEPKNLKLRSFLFFSTFPYGIKEKSVATLAIRNIAFQSKNTKSVHRITELATLLGTLKKRGYLKDKITYVFELFLCLIYF